MNIQLKFYPLHFLGAILAGFISYEILSGDALNYVHFAGVANEIGCAVISLTMAILMFVTSFERIKK